MTEHQLQVQICQYLTALKIDFFAVPNGGLRNVGVARKLKAEGVKAGVSDLVLVLPSPNITFVELKVGKNKQQPSQVDFQNRVEKAGYKYLVWYSLDDAVNFIEEIR